MADTLDAQPNVADPVDIDGAAEEAKLWGVGGTFLAIAALVGLAAGVASFVIRLPYFALEPGRVFETEEFIEVDGADSFTSPGEVHFVTVHQRRLAPIDWIVSSLQDGDEIFHEDEILGGQTIDEQREANAQLMVTSQNAAIAAALGYLGFETAEPAGVVVVDVVTDGALDGVVTRNDVITAIDGEAVATDEALYELLDAVDPTDAVTLTVARPGAAPQDVEVALTSDTAAFVGIVRAPDAVDEQVGALISDVVEGGPVEDILQAGDRIVSLDGQPIDSFGALVEALSGRRSGDVATIEALRGSGADEELISEEITLGTRVFERAGLQQVATQFRDAELPFDVDFTTEDIGGPSAGLAFSLTVLDVLSDGDLTGGANVVVTGTIGRDGTVGPVGGVRQKAFAAKAAGADVFIVPELNREVAEAAVPELRIESVNSLDEALAVLEEFGGNVSELPVAGEL